MTRYRYTVIAPNGRKRSGQIEAGSRDQAEALISSDGDLLIDLSDTEKRRLLSLERSRDLPSSTATDFALELAGLLTAGASLRRALDIQTEGRSKPAELARSIRKHIDEGGTLSSGLKASGGSGTLLAEFAAAGEAGAGLETLLDVGGRFLAARDQALSEIRSALAYPAFIALLALVALATIILVVAPALAPIFEESGDDSVLLMLADIGTWLTIHSTPILLSLAGALLALFLWGKSLSAKRVFNQWLWRMPVFGTIAKDLDTGQSCEVLAALLDSGRPLEHALSYASAVSGPELARTYEQVTLKIRDGQIASAAFSDAKQLPLEVRRLAVLGEQSSAFANALRQAGVLCHTRALRRIKQISSVAGPALIIGLGGTIALLMLSVLGSISSIGDSAL